MSIIYTSTKMLAFVVAVLIAGSTVFSFAQTKSASGGDASMGEKIFKKCKACHRVGEAAKNSTGPVLNNVVGRPAGSYPGYKYGKGMRAANAKGLIWGETEIFNYLANPKKYLRAYLGDKKAKAKMKFKLKKEDDRRNVIAYLLSISSSQMTMNDAKAVKPGPETKLSDLKSHTASNTEICLQNFFDKELLLIAESETGERKTVTAGKSGLLCVTTKEGGKGTVRIFENAEALEGCSRLAKAGQTQVLLAYAAFDNCEWQ